MKKQYTFTFLVLLGLTFTTFGQIAIKLTPVGVLKNQYAVLGVEWFLPKQDQISIGLGVGKNILNKGAGLEGLDDFFLEENYYYDQIESTSKPGWAFDPELRWYADKKMDGFFLGLYSSQRFSSVDFAEIANTGIAESNKIMPLKTHVGIYGLQLGFEKLLGKNDRFVFDFYFGLGAKLTNRKFDVSNLIGQGYESSNSFGLATRGNIAIGYAIH
jgi:hypothetical protein